MSLRRHGYAFLWDVQEVLKQGGWVRFTWNTGRVELFPPSGKVSVLLDGRTYQGFLHNKKIQATLVRSEVGSTETKDLVIEWRRI